MRADECQRVPRTAGADKWSGGILQRFLKAWVAAMNERAALPEDRRSKPPDKRRDGVTLRVRAFIRDRAGKVDPYTGQWKTLRHESSPVWRLLVTGVGRDISSAVRLNM
jgi:hypothetical protein